MGKNQIRDRCAACTFQRRRCWPECPLAPFFPPDRREDFEAVSQIFGASNFIKLIKSAKPHQQVLAAESLITEAKARVADPIFGLSGTVNNLFCHLKDLRSELVLIKQQKEMPCRRNTLQYKKVGSSSSPSADTLSVEVSIPSTSLQQLGELDDCHLPAPSVNKSCGACRYKKKKCLLQCPFSPFFPLNKMGDFENVVKVFSAEKFLKLIKLAGPLQQLAADSMIFEANTRISYPVLVVVGIVETLSQHLDDLTSELASIKQQNRFHLASGAS
ncbi:hypothetical protein MKW98_016131 [Papaver atlanticum]|uniref:LOB domain-containing protein n=1 Tax=Papaver atlanticum TaxID=357466 RepID=A0AAD4T702_9MAGN|nr:hypothetical protein MKW98_016131 [Papaver atlanticum]